ncbi:MAG: hypothetical protein EHM61_28385, partial [Acidobacteria bacterium]
MRISPLVLLTLIFTSLLAQANDSVIAEVQALLQAGKPDEALNAVAKLDAPAKGQPLVQHLTGLAHYQKGDYQQAVEFLTPSFAQTPIGSSQRIQAAHLLGMSHYFLGHIAQALPFLSEIAGSSLDTPETQYLRGVCQLQAQQVDEARITFSRMFSVPADSAASRLINAQMMVRQQLEELAVDELQKALALDPKLPQARFLLGELAIYKS